MLEYWIQTLGYPAIVLGAALEGETVVLIASFLAYRGYLSIEYVAIASFFGTFGADQMWFYLGRTHGPWLMQRWPNWKEKADRVRDWLHHHAAWVIIGFRFLYGLRTISPFVIGLMHFPPRRFVALNLLGSLIWTALCCTLGYLFGQVMTLILSDLRRYEWWVAGGVLAAGAIGWTIYFLFIRPKPTS
ncbi:MAG: DedA family protein [Planctomycetes bacterium]|nr:DedA family protein [Planctomycetota bacterium]